MFLSTTRLYSLMKKFRVYMLTAYFKQKHFGGIRIKLHRKLSRKYNGSCRSFLTGLTLGVVGPDCTFHRDVSASSTCSYMHIKQGEWKACFVIQANV